MAVYQPVQLEVLVVVAEGVDELLGDLEEAHVEEELQDGEDGNVEVQVHREAAAPHEPVPGRVRPQVVDLLPPDHSENEEHVRRQGHDLGFQ